ncbi:MAG: TetR/AcrR family transcriptional regulator [Candidatus Delongbacteria bacterium]|nr:TetR/AcrR family transcriptional regulator [Candidatus Delongbacteria bacterium]
MIDRQHRYHQILEYAGKLFFAEGFNRITIDELCSDLGISKKTFYQLFPSKEELVRSVIRDKQNRIKDEIEAIMANPPGSQLKLFRQIISIILGNLSVISRKFLNDLQKYTPHIWIEVDQFRRKFVFTHIEKIFHQGFQLGLFRKDWNEDLVIYFYLNAILGFITPEMLSQTNFPLTVIIETINQVMLEGLLTEEGKRIFYEIKAGSDGYGMKHSEEKSEEKVVDRDSHHRNHAGIDGNLDRTGN